ncbi:serine kinase [Actinomyces lilanjuaniae]|uniref:Serine kinase n=1 Tax=Actinomyces lilanjuaniae TaxID=2321394 RepID=A0ABM6Z3X5_9ACTO|nr:serine kinase [Actinomyces lilanjuaniae]
MAPGHRRDAHPPGGRRPVDPVTPRQAGTLERLRSVPGLGRAWPGRDGAISIECRDQEDRLRAGELSAQGEVRLLPYGTDPALPALSPTEAGTLVVHRYGRRAVTIGADSVRKAVRRGRATPLASPVGATAFAATGLRTARVLDSSDCHVDLELLPGRSLSDLGDDGLAGWEHLTQAWATLAQVRANLPVHGPRQEAQVLHRWFDRAAGHGLLEPLLPEGTSLSRLEEEVELTCAGLGQDPGAVIVAHRDLHDGQVLWDGTEASLLDLDTPVLAEPALDLGNLMAHLELMTVHGRLSLHGLQVVSGLLDDLARSLPTSASRLRVYRHAAALRLVFVHAFRPAAHTWLPAWVSRRLEDTLSTSRTIDWNSSCSCQ